MAYYKNRTKFHQWRCVSFFIAVKQEIKQTTKITQFSSSTIRALFFKFFWWLSVKNLFNAK